MKKVIGVLAASNVFIINTTTAKDTLAGTVDDWYAEKFIGLFSDCEPTDKQEVILIEKAGTIGIIYEDVFKSFGVPFEETSLTLNQVIDLCNNNINLLPRLAGFICRTRFGFYAVYSEKKLSTYSLHFRHLNEISCIDKFIIPKLEK